VISVKKIWPVYSHSTTSVTPVFMASRFALYMTATLDDRCILNETSHNICNTCSKFILACNTVKHSGMKFSL